MIAVCGGVATMVIQYLAPRLILGVLAFNLTLAGLIVPFRGGRANTASSCTPFPRDMWLPMRTIINKLEDDGWVVLRRATDEQEDCYHINARDPDGQERLLVIDPVSGKVRRQGNN